MTLRARMGPRGQVVIPRPLREALGIAPNSYLFFSLEENTIVVEKRDPEELLEEFLSAVPHKTPAPKDIDWDSEHYDQFE